MELAGMFLSESSNFITTPKIAFVYGNFSDYFLNSPVSQSQ
jgi:hypothetical protein